MGCQTVILSCVFSVVEVDTKQGLVELKTPKTEEKQAKKSFTFERVYDRL